MGVLIDETGNRYGRLLVLERDGTDYNRCARWLCQCECGNETIVNGNNLRRGKSRSCGCLAGSNRLLDGETAFNQLLNRMRQSARYRGRAWELTREQVRTLTAQNCYYCGEPPSQIMQCGCSEYTYSGIDRMDNDVGYIESNCVPCCFGCNMAKGTKTVEQFKAGV